MSWRITRPPPGPAQGNERRCGARDRARAARGACTASKRQAVRFGDEHRDAASAEARLSGQPASRAHAHPRAGPGAAGQRIVRLASHFHQRRDPAGPFLAALQPPGETRNFLEKMAKVELSHKEKMEYLYDNTAFPEVWHES